MLFWGRFSKISKLDIGGGRCADNMGIMGVWGAHKDVSWSKTIILSGHVFFEKSAIFDFFTWFFGQNPIFFEVMKYLVGDRGGSYMGLKEFLGV